MIAQCLPFIVYCITGLLNTWVTAYFSLFASLTIIHLFITHQFIAPYLLYTSV